VATITFILRSIISAEPTAHAQPVSLSIFRKGDGSEPKLQCDNDIDVKVVGIGFASRKPKQLESFPDVK